VDCGGVVAVAATQGFRGIYGILSERDILGEVVGVLK
jgi:hypothetical protein